MWTFDVMSDKSKDGKRTMIATYTKDKRTFKHTDRCFNTVIGKKEFMDKAKKEMFLWLKEPVVEPVVVEPEIKPKKSKKNRT